MSVLVADNNDLLEEPLCDNALATIQDVAVPISEPVAMERLQRAKRGFITRGVDLGNATRLVTGSYAPRPGDLVLARIDRLRLHGRLELPNGRRSVLFTGDEYIGSYANRYAPDQFEAEVPEDLSPCNLVGAGGLTSHCLSRHSSVKPASEVTPLGVLADAAGRVLNLADFALPARRMSAARPTVTAVLGSSMNAGKTTVVADLALGMTRNGLRVGAAKVTGTGAGGDMWRMIDAGCERVLDFTDAGYATTYKLPLRESETILETLVAELCESDVDTIVVEVADGILQPETRQLASSPVFRRLIDNVIFAAGDALSAAHGAAWLEKQGSEVAAISGAVTASPLAMRECGTLTSLPILERVQLRAGEWMPPGVGLSGAVALQVTA